MGWDGDGESEETSTRGVSAINNERAADHEACASDEGDLVFKNEFICVFRCEVSVVRRELVSNAIGASMKGSSRLRHGLSAIDDHGMPHHEGGRVGTQPLQL